MKKFYIALLLLIGALFSPKDYAQCTCSGGTVPDSLAYEQYFDSIIATNTVITFPQFDPAMGQLSCIRLSDTVTTVVNYNLQNNLTDSENYNFETFRRSQFTGPSSFFSSVTSPPKDFGPFQLSPYDSTGVDTTDAASIGPDTTFNKEHYSKYTSNTAPYYGSGNVNFNYLTTSTFTILTGSDNAIITLRAYTRLDVTLTYYWCPYAVLETNITNFNASLNQHNVLLGWQVHGANDNNKYEAEVSTNGKDFVIAGAGTASVSGDVASYKLIYTPDNNFHGNLYFRIKRTDYTGKYLYSEIRTVSMLNGIAGYALYPNPTITGVNINFLKAGGGEYLVELINSYAQTTYRKNYTISQNGSVNIEWAHKPAAGMYFIKVTDLKNNTQQIEKLQIL